MPKKRVPKIMTVAELEKAGAAFEKKLSKQIVIDKKNNTCTLNISYPYEVDLDRIKTERDLLVWTLHLTEKAWMKTHHLFFFIQTVAKYKGWNLHLPSADHSRN